MLNILKQLKDFLFSNFILLRVAWQGRIVARFNIVERESVKLFGHFHYWHFKQSFSSLATRLMSQVRFGIIFDFLPFSSLKVNLTPGGRWGTPASSDSPHSWPSLSWSSEGRWGQPPLSCPGLQSAAPGQPPAPSSSPCSEAQQIFSGLKYCQRLLRSGECITLRGSQRCFVPQSWRWLFMR